MLRAKLFGCLAVEVNGSPVPPIAGLKPRSVLAYLLLNPGLHPRARLAARFWPDVLDTSARASLRSALWSVRGALEAAGGEAYLAGDRSSVGIAPDLPREVDVEQFDTALAVGDSASLSEAVALASGPLLSDLADEWVLDAQDDYRDRLITAFERLADVAEQSGETGPAIEWTKRALEQDRLREGTYRQLIRRLAAAGEPAQALIVYRRCRAVLAAELGMAPTPETREIAERVRTGGSDEPDRAPRPEPATRIPRIVGRERQLDLLVEAWRDAGGGRGGLALVSGEAGIGKSRLARELVARASDDGALIAEGAPLELPGGPPFGPWLEAIQGLVAAAPAPPGDAPWPSDLARLCPLVTARWGRSSGVALGAPDLERARLFEGVVELVAWCARHRPVLVLLEDVHRADIASVTLLTYVGRRLGDIAALIVATRRDAPPSGDLDAALDAFRSRDLMRAEVVLGAMSPEQIAAIVDDVAPDLDPEIAARVTVAADGNPLLAREAARAAGSGGEPFDGIRAAIRTPVRRLPPPARLLVEVAATAGRPLDRREAAEAVGAEALHDAFLAASEAGLIDASDRQVRFVHELVRQACYAELPDARREWLHAKIAELLAHRGGNAGAAEVARHLRLAGDDDAARPQLVLAARQAQAFGALDEAAAFLREALDIGTPDRSEATATWFALAEVEGWRERREAMDDAFERGLGLITIDPDPRALASAHAARGHLLRTGLCYPRESLAAYRRALETIDEGQADLPEVRVLALAGIAWGEAMVGDPTRVPPLIAQVMEQPEAGDDLVLAIELDMVRVAAAIRENRLDDVDAPGERAIALARRVGRADLISLTSTNLAAVAACRGEFTRVLELTENGLTGGAAGPTLEGYIHAARAYAFARLGRHDDAIAAAHEEVRLYERYGQPDFEALGAFDLGVILLATGDAEASVEQLERALETPTRHFSLPLARLRTAEALLASGDLAGAEVELARFPFEPVREADMPAVLVAHLARLQGLVAAARGDRDVAERRLREAEASWRRLTRGLPAGEMFATALVDLGRPPVAGLVEPGIELGRVLAELASVLTSAGRPDEAARAAAEATTLADALAYDGYRRTLQSLPTDVADARV